LDFPDKELHKRSLALIANEVMPRVRHLGVTVGEPTAEPAPVGE